MNAEAYLLELIEREKPFDLCVWLEGFEAACEEFFVAHRGTHLNGGEPYSLEEIRAAIKAITVPPFSGDSKQ